MNGIEFLQNLRKDPRHKDAVVFVLTTSQDEFDISRAYELNVAGYIVKSRLSEQFVDIVTMLDYYWRIVELPSS
jgi:DNA-binding NarL/FixJ family response regulator